MQNKRNPLTYADIKAAMDKMEEMNVPPLYRFPGEGLAQIDYNIRVFSSGIPMIILDEQIIICEIGIKCIPYNRSDKRVLLVPNIYLYLFEFLSFDNAVELGIRIAKWKVKYMVEQDSTNDLVNALIEKVARDNKLKKECLFGSIGILSKHDQIVFTPLTA